MMYNHIIGNKSGFAIEYSFFDDTINNHFSY